MKQRQDQKLDQALQQKKKMEEAKTLKKVEVQSDDPKLKSVVKDRIGQIVKEVRKKNTSDKK